MTKRFCLLIVILLLAFTHLFAIEIYVSPNGGSNNSGTKNDPLSFQAAITKASALLKTKGLPSEGITILVLGGHYRFDKKIVLGAEFQGTADHPIIIKAVENENVIFDGSMLVDANSFEPVKTDKERLRLPSKAADKILVATIENKTMINRFNTSLMLNLSFNGKEYLPSVFPNEGYADFKEKTVTPEVTPPAIPVGKEAHGVRAGYVPYLEPGRERGWKGSLQEPRGARARFDDKVDEMAGSWQQWENELTRNNTRNQLTGFIEANWLLSSQTIYAASAKEECIHLSRALAYGWSWKNNDKPFRVFGMLCELDKPGEWHFDPLTNRLFVYPPVAINNNAEISLSVADGFIELQETHYVHIIGLSVKNVGIGNVYEIGGSNNLVASAIISNCTATGVRVNGTHNRLVGCDLVDLNVHVRLSGGHGTATEIVAGNNTVENCHIYQKNFKHEKVNITMEGVGNIFRNNLVHNSLGQAMVVHGNDHLIELNEFFNVGYDEGDGGAIYSGADLGGFGNVYQYNFFHHLMHCPGKVTRSGIHFDDGQSGGTCIGNVFYKSAAKGIFTFGGAGYNLHDNVFLEGDRGIYMVQSLGKKYYEMEKEIRNDPKHHRRGTKEDYVGRVEARIGLKGWAKSPWLEKYPLFNEIMSDTAMFGRMWPIHFQIKNNYAYGNHTNTIPDPRIDPEALAKNSVEEYKEVNPSDFVDYNNLNLQFKDTAKFPAIPFSEIGLKKDEYRKSTPDKTRYRRGVKDFFNGIESMPGTKKHIDTSILVE